jgi:hypothetical protein
MPFSPLLGVFDVSGLMVCAYVRACVAEAPRSRVDSDRWVHDKFVEEDARGDNGSANDRGEIRFERGGVEAAEEGGLSSSSRRDRRDRDEEGDNNDNDNDANTNNRRFSERDSREASDDDADEQQEEDRDEGRQADGGETLAAEKQSDEAASSSLLDEMV